jgi:hypothetical protein
MCQRRRTCWTDRNETDWDTGRDYRWDSFRPHLLTAWTHGHVAGSCAQGGEHSPITVGTAPLSLELWHHTAYPDRDPKATLAQPLIREELS